MIGSLPPLSPHARETLLDSLRAPGGYELDAAVGTSFSVDLMSALLVPMAFALFDAESGEGTKDPIALLAATRTYASRTALYCEQGRIAANSRQSGVISYLEEALHPVAPPTGGSFHPKLWVLRYRSLDSNERIHRVLCLSRNLTFDRSWDTILRLEESEETDAGADNRPLAAFLRRLDRLSPSPITKDIARSVSSARFAPPPGFTELVFRPHGGGLGDDPLAEGGESLLIVSPFVAGDRLDSAIGAWGRVSLASRAETLARIEPEILGGLDSVYEFETPEADEGELAVEATMVATNEGVAQRIGLDGLHAKIHSFERDGETRLLVGSANATNAAFGRNYEFCVELLAANRTAGPRALLEPRKDRSGLRELLTEHFINDEVAEETGLDVEAKRLEELGREIADIDLTAVLQRTEGSLRLSLSCDDPLPELASGDTLRCWPITLPKDSAAKLNPPSVGAEFAISSLSSVTRLICFELEGRMSGAPTIAFTLLADLVGDDESRLDAVMQELLSNRERLMRFLMMLLAAGTDDPAAQAAALIDPTRNRNGGSEDRGALGELPLLESLLKTFARDPERLRAFRDALKSLERLGGHDGQDLLPPDLLATWQPIDQAMGGT